MLIALLLSVPLAAVMLPGVNRWRNRRLITAMAVFDIGMLLYFDAARHYSCAYCKVSVMGGFVFITTLAARVPAQLYRHLAAICAPLAILSFIACRPTIDAVRRHALAVTPELSGLSTIPPTITRG
jgi:hypothetical protein